MKQLSEREKLIVVVGTVAGVAILLFTYVFLPLSREWGLRGARLAPKKETVRVLKQRLRAQDSLLKQREVLAMRMGTLLGPGGETHASRKHTGLPAQETSGAKNEHQSDEPSAADNNAPNKVDNDKTDESAADIPGDGDDAQPDEPESEPEPDDSQISSDEETTPADEMDAKLSENPKKKAEMNEDVSEIEIKSDDKGNKSRPEPDDAPDAYAESSVSVLTHVGRMAQESGMKIKRISQKKTSSGKGGLKSFKSVVVQVSIDGNMENLLDLLFAIEKGERFARVEQLQLRRDWSKGNAVDATLDILAYEWINK